MIEINLLPEEYMVSRKVQQNAVPVTLILLGLNAVLLSCLFIVTAVNLSRSITLNALNTRLEGFSAEQQKIIAIQQKIANLKSTNAIFSPLVTNRFLWSKKLNHLSDLVLPGIWFRNLALEKTVPAGLSRVLKIDLSVVSVAHDEMSIVGEFIRHLKTDDDFFKDFQNIELQSFLQRQIASAEVMDCTLLCSFKPETQL
jgi:Tfp pilus assembly protein PilN